MVNIIQCEAKPQKCEKDKKQSKPKSTKKKQCPAERGAGNAARNSGSSKQDKAGPAEAAQDAPIKCGPLPRPPPPLERQPAIEPIGVVDPEPVSLPELSAPTFSFQTFRVQLSRSELKLPGAQQGAADKAEREQAIQAVFTAVDAVNEAAGLLQTGQQQAARDSAKRIVEAFAVNRNAVLAEQQLLDARLLENHRALVLEVRTQRLTALDRIEAMRQRERLGVLRAGGAGQQALREKIATADAVIDGVVAGVIAPYRSTADAAIAQAKKDVSGLQSTLAQWRLAPLAEGGGRAMLGAKDEGRRQVADCKLKELRESVACNGPKLVEGFGSALKPLQSIADGLKPPMQQAIKRARQCGSAALSGSVSQAIQSIERSAEQGRDTVGQGAAANQRLVTSQLNAARMQVREQAEARLSKMQKESRRAHQRLSESHVEQQQGVDGSLQRYRSSVIDAAEDGHQRLQGAAVDGAVETKNTFRSLQLAYVDQTDVIRQGSSEGLDAGYQSFADHAATAVDRHDESSRQQLQLHRARTDDSLSQRADSMAQVTEGVAKAAAQWGQGLAAQFATQIKATGETLKGCQESFDEDIGSARTSLSEWVTANSKPEEIYKQQLSQIAADVEGDVRKREKAIADEMDDLITGDEAVADAVRGVTKLQGDAVYELYDATGRSLLLDIARSTSGDDKRAILAYLSGDQAKGAEYELKASVGFFNDDEARIRRVLRALDQDTLGEFVRDPGVQRTLADVRDVLGGVDRDVFDVLVRIEANQTHSQRLARADFLDMQHNISRAGSREEINQELARFYTPGEDRGYARDVTPQQLRRLINDQAAVVNNVTDKNGRPVTGTEADAVVLGVVKQRHEVLAQFEQARCGHSGCPQQGEYAERRQRFQQAQQDRAFALIEQGVGSVQERIALLGIEANRAGGGKIENIDRALVDPSLNPNRDPRNNRERYASQEELQKAVKDYDKEHADALRERQQILAGVVSTYGDPRQAGSASSTQQLTQMLGRGKSDLGQEVVQRLVAEPFPSARTSALIFEYSARGLGTNEELMKQAAQRLDREQIAAAAAQYRGLPNAEYGSLWDLISSETSGAEFQEMELAYMGQPRNDRERAEIALFALHQQKRDTGGLGSDLMSGSRVEEIMQRDEARLLQLTGGNITFSEPGEPPSVTIGQGNFDDQGQFTGDRADFTMHTEQAREAAKLYAKNIDEWANGVTAAIAIIGAVVATVLTGGGASPLLAAAIAGATGLASMAAKQAIKGGRYGWEEALTDLGMTGVQMVTAGLGQKLKLLAEAGKLGGPLQQALIPAIVTGGLDSLGQAALNEKTWEDGFGKGLEEMLAGAVRGAMVASVAALGTMALQRIPAGRFARGLNYVDDGGEFVGNLGDIAGRSTNTFARGVAQSISSGGGAFLSRGAELGFESLRGKYKGDAGDILVEMGKAGGQAALQGFGEGVGEAWRDRNRIQFGLYTRPNWMSPGEYQRLTSADTTRSGTAAAVEGSRFRGDLHHTPQVDAQQVKAGLKALSDDGGFMRGQITVDPAGQGNRGKIKLDQGGEIPFTIDVVDSMPPADGRVPVARFEGNAADGYLIKISAHADPEMVQRALVHELTEIRHEAKPNPVRDDLLKPGAFRGKPTDEPVRLSPHDHARIAEVEFVQHQLRAAETADPVNPGRVALLREELHSLFAHLGVINPGDGPERRRALLFEHLADTTLKVHVERSIAEAAANPRLAFRGSDHQEALNLLVERWQRHKVVGDDLAADHLLTLIQRQLMRMEVIGTDRRRNRQQYVEDAVATHVSDPEVVAALKQRLAEEPKLREGSIRRDPAASDPDGTQAARREFGDRKLFQDWTEFRDLYFKHRKGVDRSDPVHVDAAYRRWVEGGYVSDSSGRVRSVLADVDRPDPGYGHRFVDDRRPTAFERARLTDDLLLRHDTSGLKSLSQGHEADLPSTLRQRIEALSNADATHPLTVRDAYEMRQQLLAAAEAVRNDPDLSAADLERLTPLLKELLTQASKLSETLGEAAAHRFAQTHLGADWAHVPLDGRGAGLPDVVYRNKQTGRLVIIEAKGGGADLITRTDVTGTRRVEQGTAAYLLSLAKSMQGPERPPETRKLGAEIERQLLAGKLDYHLVKQKFDNDGRPRIPEQAQFALGDSLSTAQQWHRAAAAVPGELFHGEALLVDRISPRQVVDAASDLALSGQGIGASLARLRDDPAVFVIGHPDGRKARVRLEAVPAADLPEVNGERANAVWDDDRGGMVDYVIRVSESMDPAQIQRALAHDFREIGEVAFNRGTRQQAVDTNEHGLDLRTPHGRARLEEIRWLGDSMARGDPAGALRAELDALLRHLGTDTEQGDQRRLEILTVLQEQEGLTPAVWRALDPAPLLRRSMPMDGAARARAAAILHGTDADHLLRRIAALSDDLDRLLQSAGQGQQKLAHLAVERQALSRQVEQLDIAALAALVAGSGRVEPPDFAQLAAARDALFLALGIDPPALSRQDLDNFLHSLWGAGIQRGVYERYSASRVEKTFSSPAAAMQHRQALIEAIRNPPEGILIDTQNSPLSLMHEILGWPTSGEPMNDFFHFMRARVEGAPETKAAHRVYLNTRPDDTIAILNDILANLIRQDDNDAFKVKTHSSPDQITRRAEGIVVYTQSAAGLRHVLDYLLSAYGSQPERFIAAVPRMTQPVAPGIATGAEPHGSSASFGELRSNAIEQAFRHLRSLPPDQQTFERFRQLVYNELRRVHVDPDRPHENLP